eukprot:67155_1
MYVFLRMIVAFNEDKTNLTNLPVDDIQEERKIQINGLDGNDYDLTLTTNGYLFQYLDGDSALTKQYLNDEYKKQGHIGLWNKIHMFLDVNRNIVGESSCKWAIGTDYNNR